METMMNSVLLIKPERKQWIPLLHYLLINGQMLGLMRGNDGVTIRSAYKFIESTAQVHIAEGETLTLTFGDRECWWNWLFNLDLVLWLIKWFFDFGNYWDTVYEVASNGFFVLWLLRIWIIRKHYFQIKCSLTRKP